MEVVEARRDLSSTAPPLMQPRDFSLSPTHFLLLSFSLPQTHVSILACVRTSCIFTSCKMVTQGTSSTSPFGTFFDDRSLTLQRCSHLSHLSPVHSSFIRPPPLCPLVYSVHLNRFRAHYDHRCSSNSSSCTLIITLFSAEILLLVSSPFYYQTHHLLIEQSSVFRDKCFSHIFTVIARCWHAGILFLSFSVCKQLLDLKHCYRQFSSDICQQVIVSNGSWKKRQRLRMDETPTP